MGPTPPTHRDTKWCIIVGVLSSKTLMNRRGMARLAVVMLAVLALAEAPAPVCAGAASESLLELSGARGPALSLGFGVSPLHWETVDPLDVPGSAAENAMLLEMEPRGRALSFDVKLRWPGAEPTSVFEPYLVLGPALYVEEPASRLGVHVDPVLRLGAKAGAGFNVRLGKDTTLFGAYDLNTVDVGGLMSPGSRPATGLIDGYDVLYGVRFRY